MSKRNVVAARAILAAAILAAVAGCTIVSPNPTLPADAFVSNHQAIGQEAGQGTDHSGPLIYEGEHRPPHEVPDGTHISQVVREQVKPLVPDQLNGDHESDFPAADTTQPATRSSSGVSTGQFEWLGTVLATVNAEPIYADKVLSTLERALRTEAQADNEAHFREVANDLIDRQIHEFLENDLEFAAAKMSLDKKDEQIARYITAEWRKDQVRKAGGSDAQARQRAAEDGVDFDELVNQQFRLNMTRLYYQSKIFPLIQISAQDMRNYYHEHIREFQQATAAKFRLIFVSTDKSGGREAALKKAQDIGALVASGKNFADLAGDPKWNDDPLLVRKHGAVGEEKDKGWMEKGAYAVEKVEDAIWRLHPGETSTPISAPDHGLDGFYIAKLEDVHTGETHPFESQQVQDAIRAVLRSQQFAKLREEHQRRLMKNAIFTETPGVRQVMMEMVMQRYKVWTGR
ncbi:MAG TPA: peptidyl-prolyl cis-trans isomerase [Tepidisphaeraceae bacterium]|jgi:parvulin-like peptidyl-prolyl isomerase|nr:peptidyl-prolyl cis-trans isomerase [Tepidisphaeraceae bacterium]